jgi:hypothetical protein
MTATTPRLHWCNGKPRPSAKTVIVQDGYYPTAPGRASDGTFARTPRWKEIPNAFDATICQKGTREPDAGCTGCPHRRKDEDQKEA